MYAFFFIRGMYRTYPIFSYFKFDFEQSRKTLNVASPLIVQFLFSIGGWQVFFIFVEHLGERELAASQILRSVFGIVSIGTWAFASVCNTMVSNVIGQGKQREVLPVILKTAKLSLMYAAIVCLILLNFSNEFLSLYRNDVSMVVLARPSLQVIVVATLIMSLSTVMFNGVVGTGNTMVNLLIEVTCVLIYLVYCYFIIEKNRMSLQWAWGSEFVYWTTLFIASYFYIRSGKWKGKKI
jgi:MATE family multidrug resistance protein